MTKLSRWAVISIGVVLMTLPVSARTQSLDQQKAGVVRITSQTDGLHRTGTGFIVRLEQEAAYILTVSHVVEGDSRPQVEFFTRRNAPVAAQTVRTEGGDPRGLALLVVRGKDNLPPGLVALPIAQGKDASGGEAVTVIGFPQGGGAWAVLRANIVSREGRELTLDGSIAEGNSGGPVLAGEAVVGAVTTLGGAGKFGHAVPATLIRLVLDGWGVQLSPMVSAKEASSASKETPKDHDSGPGPNAGKGTVRILRASCEKLQAKTTFRITLSGEGQGPEGAVVRAAFLRDGKELSQPKPSCTVWKTCQRAAGEPDRTQWSISVMVLAHAPTDAAVSLQPPTSNSTEDAYALARAQLNCLLQ